MRKPHAIPPALSDSDLESLLSKGRIKDTRREKVIANVLGALEVSASRDRRLRRGGWLVATAALSLAAGLVFLLRAPPRDGWQSRGQAQAALAIEVGCSEGSLDRCPLGSKLVFRTELPAPGGYLAAYAEPLFAGGQRIWYWVGSDSPFVSASQVPAMLDRGVRLGPPHVPGEYALHLVVAHKPLSPAEAVAQAPADILLAQTARLSIVP